MLPRLYAIADASLLSARTTQIASFAEELRAAGVTLLQYRNKQGGVRQMLDDSAVLKEIFSGADVRLIFNDRADLALLARFDGVHVGQEDLRAEDARNIMGPFAIVGVSTHSLEQVVEANATSCDYIAFGPIFNTASKDNPDPTVGLSGLRRAREHTQKPLVAIGGITPSNCRAVIEAGADSFAVISGLLPGIAGSSSAAETTRQIAEEFLGLVR